MKIGLVWHDEFPWDIRLEKVMSTFIKAGHDVCLVSRGDDRLSCYEELNGVRIYRVLSRTARLPYRLSRALNYPLFFNPIWKHQVYQVMKRENVDVIAVRDLPLGAMALRVGWRLRRPVLLDMAENYPAALMAYENPVYKPFLFGNGWLPKKYEQSVVRALDHVLVVTEEQEDRLQRLGVEPANITIVRNTPEPSFYAAEVDVEGEKKPRNLLFVGKLDAHRGAAVVIRALPGLIAEFPDLTVTLVGNGTEKLQLERLAAELAVADRVQFPGWVQFPGIRDYIRDSTVCLIPHLRNEHTDTTLPNKLFDYMAFGKPIAAANCIPLERVLQETGTGLTFRAGDVADLQRVLRSMLQDGAMRSSQGRRGREAVQKKYNWQADQSRLLQAFTRQTTPQFALAAVGQGNG